MSDDFVETEVLASAGCLEPGVSKNCIFPKGKYVLNLLFPLLFLCHGQGNGLCHDLLIAQSGFCRLVGFCRWFALDWRSSTLARGYVVAGLVSAIRTTQAKLSTFAFGDRPMWFVACGD